MARSEVQRAQLVLLAVLGVLLLVLLVSGLILVFRYVPAGPHHHRSAAQTVHRWASTLFVLAALGMLAVSIAVSLERRLRRGVPAWALGAALFVAAAFASFSGYLLPWDQLALRAVMKPTSLRGFQFVFHKSAVQFVLLGGFEVGAATVRRWFWIHTAVVPVVLLITGWFVARRRQAAVTR